MNPVQLFVLLALALALLVVVILWWQLARAARRAGEFDVLSEDAVETPLVNVFREQLADLQAQRQQGELSDAEFERAKSELESRLLADIEADGGHVGNGDSVSDASRAKGQPHGATRQTPVVQSRGRGLAWGTLILVPVLSILGYGLLGRPMAIIPEAFQSTQAEDAVSPQQLAEMAEGLRDKLKQDPSQAQGWLMLARVERARGQWDAGLEALDKAAAIAPSTEVTLERAELLAQKQSGRFDGEPWALIRSVLRNDPKHPGGHVLAGSASYSAGEWAQAEGHWTQALKVLPADSAEAQAVREAINQARAEQGKPPLQQEAEAAVAKTPAQAPSPASSPAPAWRIEVSVDLSPEAKAKHKPSDVVFVYAQAAGSRMPLAVNRTTVAALPAKVLLDPSMVMAQGMAPVDAKEAKVSARISGTGQALAQPGEWGASQSAVSLQGQPKVTLKIAGPLP